MKLNFEDMFSEFVAATKKEWAHDRQKSVGASEVFACLRMAWFKKRGDEFTTPVQIGLEVKQTGTEILDDEVIPIYEEVPIFQDQPMYPVDDDAPEGWGAARRGDLVEAHFVVPTIRDHLPKGKLLWGGTDQKTLHHGYNSATPDGLIVGVDRDSLIDYGVTDILGNCFVLEIKSIDPRVNLEEAKAIHIGQAKTQLGIIREKTPYKPMNAIILYVDASFLDKISVFVVKFEETVWEAAQTRANIVFTTDDPALVPPEGKITNECQYCPFQRSCAIVTCGSIPEDNAAEAAKNETVLMEFDDHVAIWKQSKAEFDAAEEAYKGVRQQIKDALIDAGTRKLGGKKAKRPWSVSWTAQEGASRLDQGLLRNALGDLEPFKTSGDPFDVLRVTFAKESSSEDNA